MFIGTLNDVTPMLRERLHKKLTNKIIAGVYRSALLYIKKRKYLKNRLILSEPKYFTG